MSFSGNVKEELAGQISNARHCQIAECAAILYFSAGAAMEEEEHPVLKLSTENIAVARKYFTLLEKAFNIKAEISIRRNQDKKSILYLIAVGGRKQTEGFFRLQSWFWMNQSMEDFLESAALFTRMDAARGLSFGELF